MSDILFQQPSDWFSLTIEFQGEMELTPCYSNSRCDWLQLVMAVNMAVPVAGVAILEEAKKHLQAVDDEFSHSTPNAVVTIIRIS